MEAVKRYLLFILTLLFGFSCSSNDEPNDDGGQAGSSTSQSESFFGVNMSGAEFASVYPGVDGTHYGYPSREDLEYFKKKGFNLIRFPFRWERQMYGTNSACAEGGIKSNRIDENEKSCSNS